MKYIVTYTKKNGDVVEKEIQTYSIEDYLEHLEVKGYTNIGCLELWDDEEYWEPTETDEWHDFDPDC